MTALLGRTLGDFVVRAQLGEGGQGVVYRAEQPALGREAVIKVIQTEARASNDLVQRFLREARLASKLDHPYAAHIYAFGAEPDGLLWIAMELVRGTPLDRVLAAQGPMSLERFVPFFERLCEVVHTAHDQGIVHRDLKPANVMIIARAGRVLPKLLDLGIAKLADAAVMEEPDEGELEEVAVSSETEQGLTRRGEIVGSPRYMAPEQWLNRAVDARTDVYALGVVAYEALTGRRPFSGESMRALARAHAKGVVPPLGDSLPAAIHGALVRAMAKKPADRFATAIDLAAAVRAASGLDAEREALPRLDEDTRAAVLTDAPQPLADAVALLDETRNGHQARDAVWEVVATLCHLLGVLVLACRSRLARRPESELLLALTRRSLTDAEWLELARQLTRDFAHERDAFPIPELVGFVLDGAGELEALATAERGASFSEAQLRPILTRQMASLGRVLRSVAFLADYHLATVRDGVAEAWVGTRRAGARAIELTGGSVLTYGSALVDALGRPILLLTPLVQRHAPTPGAADELFFFAGKGRRGARFLAPPRGFERTDDQLWDWFREHLIAAEIEAGSEAETVPYRGLQSFTREDAAVFFGREQESDAFRNRLRVTPLLAVVGPSGAGKSSFVEAGVIPGLPAGWRAVRIRPGAAPLAALSTRLDAEKFPAAPTAGERLRAAGVPVLLVVDQCEELFTLCQDAGERLAYARALAEAARSVEEPVRVVLTLRDDFLVRATELGPFRERIGQGLQILTVPAHVDLLRILTLPAERAGYRFEDVDLPARMVDAVAGQPGALALLSFTAARMWELRDRHFKQLPRKAYEAIGGVAGALAQHAEAVREAMPPDEQRLLRDAFRTLVTAEGTRAVLGRAELHEVLGGSNAASRVIARLVDARLLVTSESESGATIEVIHEALLSAWPRLVQWRHEDAEGAHLRDQLRAAARQWEDRGRAPGLLWRDDAVLEYQLWRTRYPGKLSAVEAAFGETSVAEGRRATRNRRLLLSGILAGLAVALVVTLVLNHRATVARDAAEDRTTFSLREQGRQSLLAEDPLRALPYLVEALRRRPTDAVTRFLIASTQRLLAPQLLVVSHDAMVNDIAFVNGDAELVTISDDETARLSDIATGERKLLVRPGIGRILELAVHPGGREVALGGSNGAVVVWSLERGTIEPLEPKGAGVVRSLEWSADGRFVGAAFDGGAVVVWDATSRARVRGWSHGDAARVVVRLGPNGEAMSAGGDGRVVLSEPWLETTRVLRQESTVVTSLSVDWPTRVAAWTTRTGRIVVFDFERDEERTVVSDGGDGPFSVTLLGDGRSMVSSSGDERAILWRLGPPLIATPLVGHRSLVGPAVVEATGNQLATISADATARLRDRTGATVATLYGHTGRIWRAAYDSRGQRFATASFDGTARVWSTRDPLVTRRWAAHATPITGLEWSPDGTMLATSGRDGFVRTWSPDGKPMGSIAVGAFASNVRVSPDSRRLAIGSDNGFLLADAMRGTPILRAGGPDMALKLCFLGSSTIIVGREDGTASAFSSEGRLSSTWSVHRGRVHSVECGEQVLTTGEDGAAKIWTPGRELIRTIQMPIDVRWSAMASARDLLMIGGEFQSPATFDRGEGIPRRTLEGHTGGQWKGEFLGDGQIAVTLGYDQTLRTWDAVGGVLLTTIRLPEAGEWLSVRPGKSTVAVGMQSGSVLLFSTASKEATVDVIEAEARCQSPFRLRDGALRTDGEPCRMRGMVSAQGKFEVNKK